MTCAGYSFAQQGVQGQAGQGGEEEAGVVEDIFWVQEEEVVVEVEEMVHILQQLEEHSLEAFHSLEVAGMALVEEVVVDISWELVEEVVVVVDISWELVEVVVADISWELVEEEVVGDISLELEVEEEVVVVDIS